MLGSARHWVPARQGTKSAQVLDGVHSTDFSGVTQQGDPTYGLVPVRTAEVLCGDDFI